MIKILSKIQLKRAPKRVKIVIAKILIKSLNFKNYENDIKLYKSLKSWIATEG